MSFYDSTFVGLDDEAVGADEFVDVYLEAALRSNVRALLDYGQRCSWAPLTYDADDDDQDIGCVPYASVAYSSILNVPWIIQPGQSSVELTLHYRSASEHGSGAGGMVGRVTLSGANPISTAASFADTATNGGVDWETAEGEVTLEEPAPAEAIVDLRLEARSVVGSAIETSNGIYALKAFGARMEGSDPGGVTYNVLLYESGDSTRPDSTDPAVEAIRWNDEGLLFDVLSAQDDSASDDAGWVRAASSGPLPAESDPNNGGVSRMALTYLQTRGAEVRNRFDVDWQERPQARYDPQRPVEGRDEAEHPLAVDRLHLLKRPLWIGPQGRLGSSEDYPTGYGPRFARVTGSTSATEILTASIHPVTDGPTIRVLANVLITWGGRAVPIASLSDLEEWSGTASWTIAASVERYTDAGGTTPSSVASGATTQTLTAYPRIPTPVSAAITTEAVLEGFDVGTISYGSTKRAHKEGQLYAEDYALQQLVIVDVDASSFDPTAADEPLFVRLDASATTASLDFPELEGESSSGVAVSDLILVVTGASIWEVPQ